MVIDSVAALFRCHYESHNLVARAKHLASLATQLRKLAVQYNVAVVCVNQVVEGFIKLFAYLCFGEIFLKAVSSKFLLGE